MVAPFILILRKDVFVENDRSIFGSPGATKLDTPQSNGGEGSLHDLGSHVEE